MKHRYWIMLLLLWVVASTACAQLVDDQYLGKKYGAHIRQWVYLSDGLKVKGQLYLPEKRLDSRMPIVVFSHDGVKGISKEHRLSSIRLAREGYVVFAPSYRGEDGSEGDIEIAKGEVEDVLAVLPILKTLSYADPERIALVGASHGALISMLAARKRDDIDAIVAAYGVMDIYQWWRYLNRDGLASQDRLTRQTYGRGPQDRPHSFLIRNAVSYAGEIKAPVLILQGMKDKIVPPEQAQYMVDAMDRYGKTVDVRYYPHALHGFLVYAPYDKRADAREKRETEEAWQTMLKFLKHSFSSSGFR